MLINKNVRMFSLWPRYSSSASRIGLRVAVLALGFALGHYNNPHTNTTGLGPVTGLI